VIRTRSAAPFSDGLGLSSRCRNGASIQVFGGPAVKRETLPVLDRVIEPIKPFRVVQKLLALDERWLSSDRNHFPMVFFELACRQSDCLRFKRGCNKTIGNDVFDDGVVFIDGLCQQSILHEMHLQTAQRAAYFWESLRFCPQPSYNGDHASTDIGNR
jgi:hypothetical protein